MKHIITSHLSKIQFLEALKLYGRDEKELWEFRLLSEKINNFYYKINGDNFKITKPTYMKHPLKAHFLGTVSSSKAGSIIEGEFTMPVFVKIFIIFWLTMLLHVIYLAGVWIGPAIVERGYSKENLTASGVVLLVVILWFSIVVWMFRWSWQMRKNEEEDVISFLQDVSQTSLGKRTKKEKIVDTFHLEDIFVKYKPLRDILMAAPMIGGITIWFMWGQDQLSTIFLIAGAIATFFNFYNSNKHTSQEK